MRRFAIPAAALFVTTAANAHPDHVGLPAVGLAHYLTDPFHVATAVLGIATALSIAAVAWRARPRTPAPAHRRH